MKRLLLIVAGLVMVSACSSSSVPVAPDTVSPAAAATGVLASDVRAETSTQNEFIPTELAVFVACAAAGAGELVELEGSLHVRSHVTRDGTGAFHLSQHFQPQGISGTGLTTGDRYRGTGVTRSNTHTKAGLAQTYVNNFRIIGRGPGNNHLVHETLHVKVDADGVVTTERADLSIDCK
jgi:hypothetical protein